MPVIANLQHLARGEVILKDELPAAELELGLHDPAVRAGPSLRYDLVVEQFDRALLVRGRLEMTLHCVCVRCLSEFTQALRLAEWTCHVPLDGEEALPVAGDCVDLTPRIREDILLALPQHPVCKSECKGLVQPPRSSSQPSGRPDNSLPASAWSELDRLRF